MNNNFFYTILLFSLNVISQNLMQGEVTYKIKPINFKISKEASQEIKDDLNRVVEIANNQSFTLTFKENKSKFILNYFMPPNMNNDDIQYYNSMAAYRFTSNYSESFLDINKGIMLLKQFDVTLLEKKIKKINWQLTTESKTVDSYLCYKATLDVPYFNRRGEPKVYVVIAWYAPNLPYSYGPKEFYGLPGLILELEEKETIYFATQIKQNSEKTIEINFPKGKTVDFEEYEKSINMTIKN